MRNICYKKLFLKIIFFKILSVLFFFNIFLILKNNYHKKKVGVIGLEHSINIGNNLLKYAMFIELSNLGYDPYIVGMKIPGHNISFIQNTTKVILINSSFSEIKQHDFDILMVNSDQTWRKWPVNNYKYFYDIAFLNFAEKWNIPKFVYGASLGNNNWEKFNKDDEKIAKMLLKNFTGISVREKGSINLIENILGIRPNFVLDPTLLIDKKYYLNLIKNYKGIISSNNDYIFFYNINNLYNVTKLINKIKEEKKYKIYCTKYNIKDFIYGIYYSKGVITDSFHGTVFSIIFQKPFITLINVKGGEERFNSLKDIFNIENRIYDIKSEPDISLLEEPLILKLNLFNKLKKQSIWFIKKNLES